MIMPSQTVARKLLMAVTGQLMILYVVLHVLGNSTIYVSGLNAYAAALQAFPPFIWTVRTIMFAAVALHIYLGIVLTLENRRAVEQPYVVKKSLASTFAGRNMIWTGSAIGAFLVYHVLHFTVQVIAPSTAAVNNPDRLGRPDVLSMVLAAFSGPGLTALYTAGVAALLLHLFHGIQSSFQTWGLNSERTFPFIKKSGLVAAVVLFLSYAAIPLVIAAGILK